MLTNEWDIGAVIIGVVLFVTIIIFLVTTQRSKRILPKAR
jgi:hypothetical protein